MLEFITEHGLDLFTTILGLVYIFLEYKAHIAVWLVGIIMPALDVWLYASHGLYGDAGMAVYYTLAAVYGYAVWRFGFGKDKPAPEISSMPTSKYGGVTVAFFVAWAAVYFVLSQFTNSTVPVLDSFTNAVSFIALWALARKYKEQWLLWIVVDAVACYLYVIKGIPFKALLYGLYIVIAVAGYLKWSERAIMNAEK